MNFNETKKKNKNIIIFYDFNRIICALFFDKIETFIKNF